MASVLATNSGRASQLWPTRSRATRLRYLYGRIASTATRRLDQDTEVLILGDSHRFGSDRGLGLGNEKVVEA